MQVELSAGELLFVSRQLNNNRPCPHPNKHKLHEVTAGVVLSGRAPFTLSHKTHLSKNPNSTERQREKKGGETERERERERECNNKCVTNKG